jgi:hypothetical protein
MNETGRNLKEEFETMLEYYEELKHRLDNYEHDPYNYVDSFEDHVDEEYEMQHGELRIYGHWFTPSQVLKRLDSTAYEMDLDAFADWRFEDDKTSDSGYVELLEDVEGAKEDLLEIEKKCLANGIIVSSGLEEEA